MSASNALVTGASSGIGEATCRSLIAAGYRVVGTSRDPARLDGLTRELGAAFHAAPLDLNQPGSARALIESLPDSFCPIDVLVNNAGHDQGGRRRFDEADAEEMCGVVETNINGLIRMTHCLIGDMLARGRGHIVNLGSVAGIKAFATMSAYVASKYAVHGFSETLRLDYAGSGIRVTEIQPGLVRTGFAERRLSDADGAAEFYEASAAYLRPQDIADTIRYAVSAPAHVEVSELLILPVAKPGQTS